MDGWMDQQPLDINRNLKNNVVGKRNKYKRAKRPQAKLYTITSNSSYSSSSSYQRYCHNCNIAEHTLFNGVNLLHSTLQNSADQVDIVQAVKCMISLEYQCTLNVVCIDQGWVLVLNTFKLSTAINRYQVSINLNQSIFICIAPNHNKVISRHFTHRAGSKPNSSGFNFKDTQHSHMSNKWQEKTPF